MISKKMQAMTANSSVIRAMFEEGARLAKEYGAENVFDFSIGNPSVTPPPQVAQAICDCLEEEPPLLLHGYMNNSGYESVRTAIANHPSAQLYAGQLAHRHDLRCGRRTERHPQDPA